MPGSIRENDNDVIKFVKESNIKTVLDIGAGRGTYGSLLREHVDTIDAIEIWEPYISEFGLENIYDSVQLMDFRDYAVDTGKRYDLIIFGDVLEHMSREESLQSWAVASYIARYGLISVPIIHYPQGAEFGNPYEVHVQEHLEPEDIRKDYGPFILDKVYKVTGTFIREFEQ